MLECTICDPFFSARIKLKTDTGMEQYSPWVNIFFKEPIIDQIYVTDGITTLSRHVHIVGKNFGLRGTVVVHTDDSEIELPLIDADSTIQTSGSHVISYDHSEIHIEFYGVAGVVSIKRAGVHSSTANFAQLSPSILKSADGQDNTVYMKSDEVFSMEERIHYDAKGLGYLPSECRVLGQENLPSCLFF